MHVLRLAGGDEKGCERERQKALGVVESAAATIGADRWVSSCGAASGASRGPARAIAATTEVRAADGGG